MDNEEKNILFFLGALAITGVIAVKTIQAMNTIVIRVVEDNKDEKHVEN